jgi:hypothetical protein
LKNPLISSLRFALALLGLTGTTLLFGADVPPAAGASLPDTPAVVTTEARLKGYGFDRRVEFGTLVKSLAQQIATDCASVSVGYNEMEATSGRRSTMEAVRTARADFNDKVAALDNVAPETWENTKANLITSWKHFEEVLQQARAQKT